MQKPRCLKVIFLPILILGFFSVTYSARADTATINAALGDGDATYSWGGCNQATWSQIRNISSASSRSYVSGERFPAIWAGQCANGVDVVIRRAFFPFDTSALPDGAVITAATLNIYVSSVTNALNDGNDFLSVVKSNQASTVTLLVADYRIADFTEGSSRIDISSISPGGWVSLPLNAAGRSWISTTGNTMLAVLDGHDILNIYNPAGGQNQVGMRFANYGGAYIPYLQITYTVTQSNGASFVSQTAPPLTMAGGATANVSVTMQNTGTATWTSGGNYRLGSQNPQDNTTWGMGRVNLPVASVAPGSSATFNFTVTAPSTPGTYNFQWRMVQDGVEWFGAYSTNVAVTVTASDTTPPVISSVAASGITTNSATITWTTNEVSDSRVEYGLTSAYGSAVSVAESVTSHSSALSGLSAGTLYHYRVRSRDAALNISYSPDATFTTTSAPDTTAPTPPTVSLGSATQNSLTASWSGATDNVAVTGYRLDVSTSAAFGTFVSGYNNLDVGNVTSRVISGLSPSTTYYTRVRAYDAAGNTSANSNVPSLATMAPPPPPNVSGYAWADDIIGWIHMSGTAGDSSPYGVFVSSASPGVLSGYAWANPNDGVQNHIGWIDFGPVGSYPVSSFVPAQSARLNRTTGLVSGWARVCSVFASGCSGALKADSERGGWDGWIGFGTGGNYTQPVTVSGCNWSGYAWGGGTTIGWIHFGGGLYPTTGSGDACAAVTPACSDGIDNDGDGLIDLADPGCIDANDDDEAGPAAPSGLSADAGSGAVCNAMVIAWTDNATNEDRFELERKRSSDPDTAYVEIAEPSVGSTSFTDTGAVGGLLRDTSYTYRIRACNLFGCGAYSNTDAAINQNPLPSFTWTPPSPLQNANTTFNASASTIYGGSSASEYLWTLTDGIPATFCSSVAGSGCDNPPLTPLASTRFQLPPSPEQKSVILRVTDSASRSCSFTQTVSLRTNSTLPQWREEAPE